MIYILDTQTGAFKRYITSTIYEQGGLGITEYFLVDEIDPDNGHAH